MKLMKAAVLTLVCGMLPLPATSAEPKITDVQVITIDTGYGVYKEFGPDGRDVGFFQAWRDNGNAHGYTVYMAVMEGHDEYRGTLVGFELDPKALLQDSIRDIPFEGEDPIQSLRFARGKVNGKDAGLLIVASRNIATAKSLTDPTPTTVTTYQLVQIDDDGRMGSTPFVFKSIRQMRPKTLYCNADIALKKEIGAPLPEVNEDRDPATGCFQKR